MNPPTPVRFRTNIDCMKRHMGNISSLPFTSIAPMVGDLVCVYHDSEISIFLAVIQRSWEFTNGHSPELICELHLPPNTYENLAEFIKIMHEHGFR